MAKKIKSYQEFELIKLFGLTRLAGNDCHPLMSEWMSVSTELNEGEQYLFDYISDGLLNKIVGWNEEMLKMNLISPILILARLKETPYYKTYYESTLEAEVNHIFLKVRSDMMIAQGVLEYPDTPYFYFQEYKKQKDPKGDVTAQVLQAFLIAQAKNNHEKPLYGCTVTGKIWEFIIMKDTQYMVSQAYDCTKQADLLAIISILRKFKEILETKLL